MTKEGKVTWCVIGVLLAGMFIMAEPPKPQEVGAAQAAKPKPVRPSAPVGCQAPYGMEAWYRISGVTYRQGSDGVYLVVDWGFDKRTTMRCLDEMFPNLFENGRR